MGFYQIKTLALKMAAGLANLEQPAKQWYSSQALIEKCHKENIFLSINSFRRHRAFTDVVVYVAKSEFHAHRLILASSSPVLETMLISDMKEKAEGRVTLTNSNISPNIFEEILSYMYSGKIILTIDNVEELLYASCFLMMHALRRFCEDFLIEELNINNCLGIREIASKYACQGLFSRADRLLQTDFLAIVKTEEFGLISAQELCSIISKDELEINEEDDVFKSALHWIDKRYDERIASFSAVLEEVRLQYLSDTMLSKAESICKSELSTKPDSIPLISEAWVAKGKSSYTNKKIQVGKHIKPRRCLNKKEVIFCCGGYDGSRCMQTCIAFIPNKDKVCTLQYMKVARQDHSLAFLDGHLYVCGGFSSHKGPLDSVECFNPIRNEWKIISPMNAKRKALGVTVLNGKLYASGGLDGNYASLSTVEIFDPKTSTWRYTGSLNEARYSHCLVADEQNIYAVGGWKLSSVERFDPHESSWELISHMSVSRAGATAALLNGNMYIFGGRGDNGCLTSMEVYNISTDQWLNMPDASVARWRAALCCIDNSIYILGGRDSNWQYLDCIESFNVDTGKWQVNGKLYSKLMGLSCSRVEIPLHYLG